MLRNCRNLIVSFVKSLSIFALLMVATTTFAQTQKGGFVLSGKVISSEGEEPLEMVLVKLSTSSWAMTNEKGEFKITALKQGIYKYEISYLGFETVVGEVNVTKNISDFKIIMRPMGLGLDEIVVTAEEQKMGSASTIGQAAIQHLQAKSVEDMLQLLPGQVTKNPDLTNAGQASIREIDAGGNANNSLGTAVFVDGAPMSNDANMQVFSTANSGTSSTKGSGGMNNQTTAGRGVDLRSISPDNIESIEVIRGIPSVEYGNLTSGAVVIKTKVGTTPYEAKVKVDPNSKLAYFGKGFTMKKNRGAINLSADYTKSYNDPRKKFLGFDRITANGAYSNTFMKETTPLSLNLKFSYYRNLSTQKEDESQKEGEKFKSSNQGIRFSADGMWRLNKSWISNLNYSFSTSYSIQKDEMTSLASGDKPFTNAKESGEFLVDFLPNTEYLSTYSINGKPLTINVQLKANKMFSFERGTNNIKVGGEYNLTANKGDGLVYDPLTPPSTATDGGGSRPRSYKSIPAMHQMSYYLENATELNFAGTTLNIQAGVRVNTLFIDELAKRGNITTLDPRINLSYQFLSHQNNKIFDDMSIVGGFGLASKMPTLMYLYPNPAYFDFTSLNINPFAVLTTDVVKNTANANLKPTTSRKFEIGLTARINKFRASVTYFNERYENEFNFINYNRFIEYNDYYEADLTETPKEVFYEDGQLYYTTTPGGTKNAFDYSRNKKALTYNIPGNNTKSFKQGIEYSFNLGEIKPIKTDIIVDGAWYYIKRISTLPQNSLKKIGNHDFTTIGGKTNNIQDSYILVTPGGNGEISQRFNTTFRFVTHIPVVKLVFTTTAQVVWYESSQYIYQDSFGNDIYKKGYEDGKEFFYVDPIGYYNREGIYTSWEERPINDPEMDKVLHDMSIDSQVRFNDIRRFNKEVYPITCVLNFKLTKEFKDIVELSFVANNFLKFSKKVELQTRNSLYELYKNPLYFGAEIKIKI